jgi:hypothetical protein
MQSTMVDHRVYRARYVPGWCGRGVRRSTVLNVAADAFIPHRELNPNSPAFEPMVTASPAPASGPARESRLIVLLLHCAGFSIETLRVLVEMLCVENVDPLLSVCKQMHEYDKVLYVAPEKWIVSHRVLIATRRHHRVGHASMCGSTRFDVLFDTSSVETLVVEEQCTDASLGFIALRFPNLKSLTLQHCEAITDVGLRMVAQGFPQLCSLALHHCRRYDCESHKRIYTVTESGIIALAQGCFEQLSSLDLAGFDFRGIPDTILHALPQRFSQLSSVRLSAWSDTVPEHHVLYRGPGDCYDIEGISEDKLLAFARGCSHPITEWELAGSNITDYGLEALSLHDSFSQVTFLDLSGCIYATGQGVIALSQNCSQLTGLDLTECRQIAAEDCDDVIRALSEGCPHLESLKLDRACCRSGDELSFRAYVRYIIHYSAIMGTFEDDLVWDNGFYYDEPSQPSVIDWTNVSFKEKVQYDDDDDDYQDERLQAHGAQSQGDRHRDRSLACVMRDVPAPERNRKREKKRRQGSRKNKASGARKKKSSGARKNTRHNARHLMVREIRMRRL